MEVFSVVAMLGVSGVGCCLCGVLGFAGRSFLVFAVADLGVELTVADGKRRANMHEVFMSCCVSLQGVFLGRHWFVGFPDVAGDGGGCFHGVMLSLFVALGWFSVLY